MTEQLSARELFQVGQRVQMTALGRQRLLSAKHLGRYPERRNVTTGQVVGFSRSTALVRIQRDLHMTVDSYYAGYWEPAP